MLYPIQIKTPENLISESDFLNICINNPELNFERNQDKSIVIMAPTTFDTGRFNAKLITQFENWNVKKHNLGCVFYSSTGFTLPNGAVRSPDVSWITKARIDKLTELDRNRFAHICPDFVLELKSKSDSFSQLQIKMNEYMSNGSRLGFLIYYEIRQVFIYHKGTETIKLFSDEISGMDVLPDFILDLTIFTE